MKTIVRRACAFATVAIVFLPANRLLFDVAEAAGLVCKPSGAALTRVVDRHTAGALFKTEDLCFATGLALEAEHHYVVRLDVERTWKDSRQRADPLGFGALDADSRVLFAVFAPGRRSWTSNWFSPIGRIGVFGRDRYHLAFEKVPGDDRAYVSKPFTARSSGELHLFVNDAVFAVPYAADLLYRNNCGTARVTVGRVPDESVR